MTPNRRLFHPAFLFTLVLHLSPGVTGVPVANDVAHSSLQRRASENDVPVQIWIPILLIGIFVVGTSILLCYRRIVAARIARSGQTTESTRELTAEQLAGTINSAANPANGASRTRRNRRPRRTPSQISTTSLPAYAKEPGEEEVVIFRGPEDMEDAGMPTAVVMPSLSEEGEHSMHSRDNSQVSRYTPMPTSPNNMPLLQPDDSATDDSMHDLQLSDNNNPRRSVETLTSSEEASSLMRVRSNAPADDDPRGEAPPYFEAVDLGLPEVSESQNIPVPPSASISPEPIPQRRSGFRGLLQSLPNRLSMASHAPSHTRASSAFSLLSSENTHGRRETSQSRASHGPSPSGSGSLLNLTPFRTISRQRSQTNIQLNSPSLISLNSISAPLTHTLTRTEFMYPKSGPTPEQLKLISSRESFARFGVPYGPDAIAYASASRHDLDMPPPDFDADIPPVPGSAGSSRLRSASNAADLQREVDESDSEPSSPLASPTGPPTDELHGSSVTTTTTSSRPPSPAPAGSPRPSTGESTPGDSSIPPAISSTLSTPKRSALPLPSPGTTLDVPPSSFRAPSVSEGRSESRSSSIQSFATATESIVPPLQSMPDNSDREPTTPRIRAQHTLEATDVTITQASVGMAY